MKKESNLLVCWRSKNHREEVLIGAIKALRKRNMRIERVLFLFQPGLEPDTSKLPDGVHVQPLKVPIENPTKHEEVYTAVRDHVVPLLNAESGARLHVDISPGTPAMHAVWLVLHAGGAFPDGTQLWSSQRNPGTEVLRIDKVEFPVSTYLAEIRRSLRLHPGIAVYDQEARSVARREALDRLARYARVPGAPILVLGERGTGKTRLIDKSFASLRGRRKVVTLPCGGLDSTLADSLLFGHVKGAFTGAAEERKGLLSEANGGILFLDEVQDLPKPAQRKLVRVFQDRQHLFRQVGADKEIQVDVDLVCASNRTMTELKKDLDPDLYDRLSALIVEIPPLRECREDLPDDWRRVWSELRLDIEMPEQAPWGTPIQDLLSNDPLPGNLRDLQRFGFVLMASWHGRNPADAISRAVVEWHRTAASNESSQPILGNGSRNNQIRAFRAALAVRSKQEFGTWKRAAKALGCDEKTLREDAQVNGG